MEYNSQLPNSERQDENALSIRDIWNLCLSHWKWFLQIGRAHV